jgi:hypothetical protein
LDINLGRLTWDLAESRFEPAWVYEKIKKELT